VTDLHLLPEPDARLLGIDTLATLEAALEAAFANCAADLVVVTGDIAHVPAASTYARAQDALCRYHRGPSIWLPGNHDVTDCMAGVLPALTDIVLGSWHVIGIDTHVDGQERGHVGEAELERIEGLLAASSAAHVLVLGHHPCRAVGTPWLDAGRIDDGEALLSMLARDGRVSGYAFGHIHHGAGFEGAPVPLFSAPSSAFEFAQGGQRFGVETRAPGCRVFDLGADGRLSSTIVRAPDLLVTPDLAAFH